MSIITDIVGSVGKLGLLNLSKRRLPQIQGELHLKSGIQQPVEIIRDAWGIPHIYAQNMPDLAFAQGFTHAQDRLWQMELSRRAATGKLSEVFGKLALPTDIASRTFGFARLGATDAQTLPIELQDLLGQYVNGINHFIQHYKKNFPIEFTLLRFDPTLWTVNDLMAFSRLMTWQLSAAWQGELIRAQLADLLGKDLATELDVLYPNQNPDILAVANEVNLRQIWEGTQNNFLRQNNGSNSWAISGSRTHSGKPILANDPHLHLGTPAIWYENHLHCPQLHVTGVSIPGLPLVLIGHNRHLAWGITLAYTDAEDLFIEKFTDFNAGLYQYQNTVEQAQILNESIAVKDSKQPHPIRILVTRHGPIISDVTNGNQPHHIALQSTALQPAQSFFRGWWQLNHARHYTDFVHAVSFLSAPQLNIVFADTQGNIGYYTSGKVPIRQQGNGKYPAPGYTGTHEWTGFVPFMEMPHALNPQKGYIITANNRIISQDYPYFLGDVWMNGYRANRLESLILQQHTTDLYQSRLMQTDVFCIPGKTLAQIYQQHLPDAADLPPRYYRAWQLLADWDGFLSPHTAGGAIYALTRKCAMQILLKETLGAELLDTFTGKGFNPVLKNFNEWMGHDVSALLRILQNPDSLWLQKVGGKTALLRKSLMAAVNQLTDLLGKHPEKWEWGKLHKFIAPHALGIQKPFDRIFNIGGIPMGGDGDTPLQAGTPENEIPNTHLVSASYRQVIDLSDWGKSLAVLPTGQSGHLASPHYKDQTPLWLQGELRPMLWHREQVLTYSRNILRLRVR